MFAYLKIIPERTCCLPSS